MKNIFGKFNKVIKSETLFYHPKFDMVVANPKKIFDLFFIRFISAIILLTFINWHKILNLWRTFSKQFWFKIANKIIYILFS